MKQLKDLFWRNYMKSIDKEERKCNEFAPKKQCHNCKYASRAFKIGDKTHHQCNHPKNIDCNLSIWDTLQERYNTCDFHEFRQTTESK
jgi:hypothetical protein